MALVTAPKYRELTKNKKHDRNFQDQTSPRVNTLFDDADDIQRQLDNESRDRLKFGRKNRQKMEEDACNVTPPLPSETKEWDYSGQVDWSQAYPDCAGHSQSPVDLPTSGLIKARGARPMLFQNFEVTPKSMTLVNDRRRIYLVGDWQPGKQPLIYGGAAHSRRYLFHSLIIHAPSEHAVMNLKYPLETQAFFVSAEYKDVDEALEASSADPQAFLGIVNLYKYGNHTHKGIEELLDVTSAMGARNGSVKARPLNFFNPPFKEYACYQGSLSWPPCTESVLWLIRGRTLSISRNIVDEKQLLTTKDNKPQPYLFRMPQSMNDRKVYLFS